MCSAEVFEMQIINLMYAPTKVCFVCQKLTDRGSKVSTNRGHLDIQDTLRKYVNLEVSEGWICRLCKMILHGIKRKVDKFRKSALDAQTKFRQQEVGENTVTTGGTLQTNHQDTGKNLGIVVLKEKRSATKAKGSKVKSKQPEQKPMFRTIFPKYQQEDSAQQTDAESGTVPIADCPPADDEPSNAVDHCYAVKAGQTKEYIPTKEVKLLQGVLVKTPTLIDRAQYHCLQSALQSQSSDIITTEFLRIPALRQSLVGVLADQLGSRPDKQRGQKSVETSVLMLKDFRDLKAHSWEDIICEFIQKYPELVEILLKIMLSPEARKSVPKTQQLIPKLGFVYGVILQHRNHELSRIQRLVGCLFADNVVEQKVYDRLNKLGVCSSYNRMQQMRKGVAALANPRDSNSKKRKTQKYAGTPGFSEIGEMFDQETDVVRRAR